MSYTPGPWIVFEPDKSLDAAYPGIDAEAHSIVVYGQKDADDGGVQGATREQARANAHLIAAAPDLYDACASVWLMLADTGDNELRLIADECRAAIEKATGAPPRSPAGTPDA